MAHIAKLKIWDLWSEKFWKCVPILNIPSHRLVVWVTPLTENLLMSQGRREKSWKSFRSQFYEASVLPRIYHVSSLIDTIYNFPRAKLPSATKRTSFMALTERCSWIKLSFVIFLCFTCRRQCSVHTPNSTVMSCRRPRIELRLSLCFCAPIQFECEICQPIFFYLILPALAHFSSLLLAVPTNIQHKFNEKTLFFLLIIPSETIQWRKFN